MKKTSILAAFFSLSLFVISFKVCGQIPISNLQLWLKADAGVTADINGKVSQWNDQSGNNKNATNAILATQPALTNNLINGKPGITFSGGQIMNIPAINLSATQKVDIFFVYKSMTGASMAVFENSANYNAVSDGFLVADNDASSPGSLGGLSVDLKGNTGYNIVSLNPSVNTFRIANAQFDKSLSTEEAKAFINGILQSRVTSTYNSDNSNNFGNNTSFIGARSGGIAYWAGDLSEIILYSRVLTSSERDSIVNYLGTKYAILNEICNGVDDDFDGLIDETCPPEISINDRALTEGNSGTQTMKFTVSINHPYITDTVNVKVTTADSTASNGSDYLGISKVFKILPGQTSKKISITINGDIQQEPNERFKVILSNPVNATIIDNLGIGTIRNDDVLELNAGQHDAATAHTSNIGTSAKLVKVWPNPTNGLLNVQLADPLLHIASVQITNITGNILQEWKYTASAKQMVQQLNVSSLPNGTYLVIIEATNGNMQSNRIIINH